MAVSIGNYAPNLVTNTRSWTGCVDVRNVNVPQVWAAGMARARGLLCETELFDAAELDFAALAAQPNVSVMRPQGKRIGAQLPDQPAQSVGP